MEVVVVEVVGVVGSAVELVPKRSSRFFLRSVEFSGQNRTERDSFRSSVRSSSTVGTPEGDSVTGIVVVCINDFSANKLVATGAGPGVLFLNFLFLASSRAKSLAGS